MKPAVSNVVSLADKHPSHQLLRLFEEARNRLIETGTRNRLVHTPRRAKRSKSVDIVDERTADVFRMLVREGARFRFLPDESVSDKYEDQSITLSLEQSAETDPERFTDLYLQTTLSDDMLQKKLLAVHRDARTSEEEQGVNVLYLALGFLRWFEDENSQVIREAPLILVPVALQRNEKSSAFELSARGDEILTNSSMKQRLQDDCGIRLPEVPDGEDWLPADYFDKVADAISVKSRWTIDRDGMQLGFFSFSKLLMVKDLYPGNWPDGRLLQSELIDGLLAHGFDDSSDDFDPTANLDDLFQPDDLIQVVDADASQTLAIEAVRRGRNLIIQGPPGTGKSQTITNIIAAAAHDGKKVLFIAEKMAALNVVHDRLHKTGLRDLCLELHSKAANKRQLLEELGRTLAAGAAVAKDGDGVVELAKLRNQLNTFAKVAHMPIGKSGTTPFQVLSTMIELTEQGYRPVNLQIPGIETWSRDNLSSAETALDALATIVAKAGRRRDHPFFGVTRTDLLPTDIDRVKQEIERIIPAIEQLRTESVKIATLLQAGGALSLAEVERLAAVLDHLTALPTRTRDFAIALAVRNAVDLAITIVQAGAAWQKVEEEHRGPFKDIAISIPVGHLRQALAKGVGVLGRFGRDYKAASAELEGY